MTQVYIEIYDVRRIFSIIILNNVIVLSDDFLDFKNNALYNYQNFFINFYFSIIVQDFTSITCTLYIFNLNKFLKFFFQTIKKKKSVNNQKKKRKKYIIISR